MSTENLLAAVHQYIDGFNKGDTKMMAATFAVPGRFDGWRRTCGRGQQPLRTGIETCWLKVSNTVHQDLSAH